MASAPQAGTPAQGPAAARKLLLVAVTVAGTGAVCWVVLQQLRRAAARQKAHAQERIDGPGTLGGLTAEPAPGRASKGSRRSFEAAGRLRRDGQAGTNSGSSLAPVRLSDLDRALSPGSPSAPQKRPSDASDVLAPSSTDVSLSHWDQQLSRTSRPPLAKAGSGDHQSDQLQLKQNSAEYSGSGDIIKLRIWCPNKHSSASHSHVWA